MVVPLLIPEALLHTFHSEQSTDGFNKTAGTACLFGKAGKNGLSCSFDLSSCSEVVLSRIMSLLVNTIDWAWFLLRRFFGSNFLQITLFFQNDFFCFCNSFLLFLRSFSLSNLDFFASIIFFANNWTLTIDNYRSLHSSFIFALLQHRQFYCT